MGFRVGLVYRILVGSGMKALSLRMKCYQRLNAAFKGRDGQSLLFGMHVPRNSELFHNAQNLAHGKIIMIIISD